jgi:glycosyltransferase involved in cell wall biosynthesis
MRILQLITRSESGGAQAMVAGLAEELLKAGHEVAIASGEEGGGEAWKGLDSRIELFEVGGLGRSMSPLADIAALLSIRSLYRQWKPDIVHVHTSKAAALGRLAGGVEPSRIVYTMHGYGQIKREHRLFLPLDKFLRRRTGAIVAVSRGDLAAMKADGYKASYIANGVVDARLSPPGDERIVRALRTLRATGKTIAILVARDAKPKRIDLARGAAAQLEGRAVIAWIGGDPKKGDPEGFIALGRTPKAAAYLGLADILILPSEHEGMPMSVLEGFSAGLPAVVSAVEGCLEVVGLEAAGVSERGFAVANEPRAFAEAISSCRVNAEQREIMGSAVQKAWQREYSLDSMFCAYLNLYKRIAGAVKHN